MLLAEHGVQVSWAHQLTPEMPFEDDESSIQKSDTIY